MDHDQQWEGAPVSLGVASIDDPDAGVGELAGGVGFDDRVLAQELVVSLIRVMRTAGVALHPIFVPRFWRRYGHIGGWMCFA